jgi:hypothetical protein
MTSAMPEHPPRQQMLQEAIRLTCGDRNASYGEPYENHYDIAQVMNVLFRSKLADGQEFTASDVCKIQIATKLCRLSKTPGHRDSFVDIAGYAAIGLECQLIQEAIDE